MANEIVRSTEEINDARVRAQMVSFAADDAGDTDEAASAAYDVLQWLFGDSDVDPTVEMFEQMEDE
jgi:hypothetical protein